MVTAGRCFENLDGEDGGQRRRRRKKKIDCFLTLILNPWGRRGEATRART